MASYNCVPAAQTVSPCPAGTAPDITVVESTEAVERYEGHFDHIPLQDVEVGIAMIVCMLLGVMAGRR